MDGRRSPEAAFAQGNRTVKNPLNGIGEHLMRFAAAAATLAALTLAAPAPAAAQPDALGVVRAMVTQLDRNAEGVNDYTLTLRAGPMTSDIYVYREGDEWEVASNEDEELGEMMEGMVMWPVFGEIAEDFPDADEVSEAEAAEVARMLTLTQERLDGRPANVLFMRMEGLTTDEQLPDSLRMYVDPSSNQILRIHVVGNAEGMEEMGPMAAGDMEVTVDFRDYRETDGLTVPRRLRMDLRVEMDIPDEQKQMMTTAMQAAQMEAAQDTSEEGRRMAAMIDMFVGLLTEGHMELDVEVAEVRVNQGPPSWFEG
jgi:hypothetical protein